MTTTKRSAGSTRGIPSFAEAGLRFSCTQCGNCCTGAPGYVYVSDAEIHALADHLGITSSAFLKRYTRRADVGRSLLEHRDGRCVFYKEGCTVYAARPIQCRTYPFWPEIVRSKTAWLAERKECEGIGRGRVHSPASIRKKLSECGT
jgi:Fe-S-cluster containining protein